MRQSSLSARNGDSRYLQAVSTNAVFRRDRNDVQSLPAPALSCEKPKSRAMTVEAAAIDIGRRCRRGVYS